MCFRGCLHESYGYENQSVHSQSPEQLIALAIGKHLDSHPHGVSVEKLFDSLIEVSALLGVVAELIQVVQVDPLDEIAALAIVGE